jgi:hypothetical protein
MSQRGNPYPGAADLLCPGDGRRHPSEAQQRHIFFPDNSNSSASSSIALGFAITPSASMSLVAYF